VPNPCLCSSVGYDAAKSPVPTILFTGWIEEQKGVFDLLQAFATMLQDPAAPDAKLVIAGKGRIDECRDLAKRLGISDKVELPGWLEGEALLAAYGRAHIYCLPSYIEGVPMAILEAMAFGLPIVTTPVGGIPDVVDEGVHCRFVQPGDINGIAVALGQLIDHQAEREAMGIACRERVSSRYSLELICGQLRRLYHTLVGGGGLQNV
jgi:glycosyltransferase involved in cell wall biosynthesis